MNETQYGAEFFAFHQELSRASARAVIPVLFEYVRPASVVDVGCGIGTWLAEFQAAGVSDFQGVDGDYVERATLLIDAARFRCHDLATPLDVGRRFDLAVSLEVAEHLPEHAAGILVASLVRAAPVVLFSAAIPHQPGTGHINGQWPEYWIDLFARHDYLVVDCLRRRLWRNANIAWWYRQNAFLFVDQRKVGEYPHLAAEIAGAGGERPLPLVHPDHYLALCDDLKSARQGAVSQALRLRATNLIAFPDWNQPDELLCGELGRMFAALIARSDRSQLAIVLHIGQKPREAVGQLIDRINATLPPELLALAVAGPGVSVVDDGFIERYSDILLDCVQERVVLTIDCPQAIAASGSQVLVGITLDDILSGKPLG
ncbi:MAG: methyltransferase domain-containing protein [Pirellulales bacterium]